jgi:beta-glucosidase
VLQHYRGHPLSRYASHPPASSPPLQPQLTPKGIRTVDAWITHPNITATLFAGLPGQESGHSLTSILYGDVNPSGRLPYTVARSEADYGPLLNSSAPLDDVPFPEANFTEGLFIDYRYFDRHNLTPRFEFGFGLSYTSFAYANLSTSVLPAADLAQYPDKNTPIVLGGHPALWETVAVVRCTVTNTGPVDGAEIAQLYVAVPGAGEDSPLRQLRGFVKVGPLVPGQGREAVFELTRRDLSVWDVVAQDWRLRRGVYEVWVGASSRDLRASGRVVVE